MQAYEFDTVVENGMIPIPKRYLNQHLTSVRVILLSDSIKRRKSKFTAVEMPFSQLSVSSLSKDWDSKEDEDWDIALSKMSAI